MQLSGVGIVGAGLIGTKRARQLPPGAVVAVCDREPARASTLAAEAGAVVCADAESLVARPDIRIVFISTFNAAIPGIAESALRAGKHVLAEKPAGCRATDLDRCAALARAGGLGFFVGFNHRFHPAILEARRICQSGELGDLLYVRARYGHGGRSGYEKEWRADPKLSGGGELLDQGVHLIDLARFFLGDLALEWGRSENFWWPMPVEDNGFLFLRGEKKRAAWLHASCTEWKNIFDFEMFLQCGKVQVTGLGGSYGDETLRVYRRHPVQGPPELEERVFAGPDESWRAEHADVARVIADGAARRDPLVAELADAQAALRIVEAVYSASMR